MEASGHLPTGPEPTAELVVRRGPHSAPRCPLTAPLTVLGHAPGCDIRLEEGVEALHCVILYGPTGAVLRDLGSASGTRVNGEAVFTRPLMHGDRIEVGPFEFTLELPPPGTSETSAPDLIREQSRQGELEAVRIQVAALAAQQNALVEHELRLEQRSTALEQQQQQLAAHLADRRRKLLELREEVRQERADCQAQCDADRQEAASQREAAARELAEAQGYHRRIARERLRLVELRRRLKKRWKRHWSAQEASLAQREALVRRQTGDVEQERKRLSDLLLRHNGELELTRRELREEWQQLGLAQQQLEETINQERSELDRQHQGLADRASKVAETELALAEEKRTWEQQLAGLRRESEGIETRIRHQRSLLLQPTAAPAVAPAPAGTPVIPESTQTTTDPTSPVPDLTHIAGDLADQRLHLTEQWQRLLEVHDRWQREREAALGELEQSFQLLDQREGSLRAKEHTLAEQESSLRQRNEELARQGNHLQGWHTKLTAQMASWTSERVNLLESLEAREQMLRWRADRLEEVHQRRNQRRRKELADLQIARIRCEEVRRHYQELYREYQQRQSTLDRQERTLVGRGLALEHYQQEVTAHSPKAQRRIDKLNRRETTRLQEMARDLLRQFEELQTESARLDTQTRDLILREEVLVQNQDQWKQQIDELEARQTQSEEEECQRQLELGRLRAQRESDQRHLASLREELDRLARAFMDEPSTLQVPAQAA